jgi:hypothetical protein
MKILITILSVFAFVLTSPHALAAKQAKPKVEVVFVLDTTGSMGGLIAGAKQKIWSIVNEIAKGKPTPEIKLGLVGYRDKGDQYITTTTDLTTDLDAVYAKLMAFKAGGGGDGPEHVNQALYEAVHKMSWSEGRKTLKVIFLVGDAPPHMDYKDDVKYPKTCKAAMHKDIVINTIQCGNYGATAPIWRDIALKSEGSYVAIAQTGGTRAISTPYDGRVSELSRDLDSTYVAYGSKKERKRSKAKVSRAAGVAAKAAPEAAADRAVYRATTGSMARGDLLDDVDSGKVGIDKMEEEAMPEELRKVDKKKRATWLKAKKKKRVAIQKKIQELSKKRDAYIKKEMAKDKPAASFDAKVMESIKSKAKKKGIKY